MRRRRRARTSLSGSRRRRLCLGGGPVSACSSSLGARVGYAAGKVHIYIHVHWRGRLASRTYSFEFSNCARTAMVSCGAGGFWRGGRFCRTARSLGQRSGCAWRRVRAGECESCVWVLGGDLRGIEAVDIAALAAVADGFILPRRWASSSSSAAGAGLGARVWPRRATRRGRGCVAQADESETQRPSRDDSF
jgi:hypothetical protein